MNEPEAIRIYNLAYALLFNDPKASTRTRRCRLARSSRYASLGSLRILLAKLRRQADSGHVYTALASSS